jgi:hypothetical protein
MLFKSVEENELNNDVTSVLTTPLGVGDSKESEVFVQGELRVGEHVP